MKIKITEVDLPPQQKARLTYEHVLADVQEGLDYMVKKDLCNECFEAVGSPKRVEEDMKASEFVQALYNEQKKYKV